MVNDSPALIPNVPLPSPSRSVKASAIDVSPVLSDEAKRLLAYLQERSAQLPIDSTRLAQNLKWKTAKVKSALQELKSAKLVFIQEESSPKGSRLVVREVEKG